MQTRSDSKLATCKTRRLTQGHDRLLEEAFPVPSSSTSTRADEAEVGSRLLLLTKGWFTPGSRSAAPQGEGRTCAFLERVHYMTICDNAACVIPMLLLVCACTEFVTCHHEGD